MLEFLPPPTEAVRRPLQGVVDGVLARGAPAPPWLAVEDQGAEWLFRVSARPAAERARGVLAAAGDEALVAALRLGIGGALMLPPSTPAMDAALAAAASSPAAFEFCGSEVALLAAGGARLTVWTFENHEFWKHQLGETVLASLLFELAGRLRVPPAILPWPALLVAGRTRREVSAAWKECARDRSAPSQGLKSATVRRGRGDAVAAVYRALVEAGEGNKRPRNALAEPVHELPSGQLLGHWVPSETGEGDVRDWLATPVASGSSRYIWKLRDSEREERVAEALTVAELEGVQGAAAVRVPGWALRDLRPGTPAGLLVSRLAERAARSSIPLWIPNLAPDALHFVLGLPGTLWVDGPAVPREGEEVKR